MKLLYFNDYRLGVLKGVVDVTPMVPCRTPARET
jgi:hypothetical protein